jgi:chromosome segregation ATPase
MDNTTGQSIPSQAEINEALEEIKAHFAEAEATLEHLTTTLERASDSIAVMKALQAHAALGIGEFAASSVEADMLEAIYEKGLAEARDLDN